MKYRLLCCSDTHGDAPPDFPDATATAWLHAGDLYDGPSVLAADDEPPLPGDPIADVFLAWARSRRAPVYAVHGNHDVRDAYGWFAAAVTEVDGRAERLGCDLLLVGVGWHGEAYVEMPGERDLQEVCDRVRRQLRRIARPHDRIVLLTHYPPLLPGLFPPRPGHPPRADGGSESIARLVHEFDPLLIVQGHEHRWSGLSARIGAGAGAGSTLVVNPGRTGMAVIVDTDATRAAIE